MLKVKSNHKLTPLRNSNYSRPTIPALFPLLVKSRPDLRASCALKFNFQGQFEH